MLVGMLLASACRAAPGSPPAVAISESDAPRGYDGLEFRVEAPGGGGAHLFWPHEVVGIETTRFVRRAQVEGPVRAAGGFAWTVRRLEAPELTIEVRLAPAPDGFAVRYRLANGSDQPRRAMVGPCLQLPEAFFAGVADADRARYVAVPTAERGWQRIAATRRTPGVADPERRIAPRAWTQHYHSVRGHDHLFMPHDADAGLNLFGVAHEHVGAGAIVAFHPNSRKAVAVATDHEAGVTFALLNCLHAVIQADVPARGAASVEYRVLFHEGAFPDLVARLGRALPDLDLPPAGSLD